MLKVKNISKQFNSIEAVKSVSFELQKSSITILAGADGAGKSTIFKIIVGLIKRDTGEIFINAEAVKPDFSNLNKVTGYMPEKFSLYPDLSVEENMNFFADIYGVEKSRRENLKSRLLEKTGMAQFRKRRAGALSGGMKQKLALSTILLSSPQLIILDEPTTGVDPLSRIEFFSIIEDLKNEGKTIIISTPYMEEAEKGDFVIFLKEGKILKNNNMLRLKQEFPAKIYKILPEKNIFDTLQEIKKNSVLKNSIFIRGKYLVFIEEDGMSFPEDIPIRNMSQVEPGLEDIFIYYERQENRNG